MFLTHADRLAWSSAQRPTTPCPLGNVAEGLGPFTTGKGRRKGQLESCVHSTGVHVPVAG